MAKDVFNLRDEVIKQPKIMQKQSWNWYKTQIRDKAVGMSTQRFLGDNIAHQSSRINPGTMCGFFYSPKGKEDLPYYDTFPLVLPFGVDAKTFIGLNLHYIEPKLRLFLLDKLLDIKSNRNLSDKDKLSFSWQTIKGFSEVPQAQACVKKYLFSHVKSKFIIVPQSDWYYTVVLPIERFQKKSAQYVWRQA